MAILVRAHQRIVVVLVHEGGDVAGLLEFVASVAAGVSGWVDAWFFGVGRVLFSCLFVCGKLGHCGRVCDVWCVSQ